MRDYDGSTPTDPTSHNVTDTSGEVGKVLAAVRRDLAGYPEALRTSAIAMAAEALAESIDQGPDTYRFQSALVGQLADCMEKLAAKAPAKVEGDRVDDLSARRASRRGAAASGS